MKIKTWLLAVLSVAILFGGIAVSSAMGLWQTTTDKQPAKIKDGEFAGSADPADIRGSYTFGDIAGSYGVPIGDLKTAFGNGSSGDFAVVKCKDLESMYANLPEGKEIGTGSVRYFVALYKGIPSADNLATYLPRAAAELLKQKGTLSKDQIVALEQWAVDLP